MLFAKLINKRVYKRVVNYYVTVKARCAKNGHTVIYYLSIFVFLFSLNT